MTGSRTLLFDGLCSGIDNASLCYGYLSFSFFLKKFMVVLLGASPTRIRESCSRSWPHAP